MKFSFPDAVDVSSLERELHLITAFLENNRVEKVTGAYAQFHLVDSRIDPCISADAFEQIYFDSISSIRDLKQAFAGLKMELDRSGVAVIYGILIDVTAWRAGRRCQLKDDRGFIGPLRFVASGQGRAIDRQLRLTERIDEEAYNPLAILFGHDD